MNRGYRNITYRSSPRRDSAVSPGRKYRGGGNHGHHNSRSENYQSNKAPSRARYRHLSRVRSRSTGRRESNDGEDRSSRRTRQDSVQNDRIDEASSTSSHINDAHQQRLSNVNRRKLSAPDDRRRRDDQREGSQTRRSSSSIDPKNLRRDSEVERGKRGRATSGIDNKVVTGYHSSSEEQVRSRSGTRKTSPERTAGSIQLVTSDVSSRVRNEMKISNAARCVDELGKYIVCQRSLVYWKKTS